MSGNPGEIGEMQTLCKQQSYIPFKLSFQLSRWRHDNENGSSGSSNNNIRTILKWPRSLFSFLGHLGAFIKT